MTGMKRLPLCFQPGITISLGLCVTGNLPSNGQRALLRPQTILLLRITQNKKQPLRVIEGVAELHTWLLCHEKYALLAQQWCPERG
jgi:uncharacterized Zn finger protein